ncbi:MAG: hypothetical protein J7623_16380 [Chitinophaga sp.]|uniref:hypothetical protein n=1 Tax=Chitinophaga sp. TaxID=1869181 RepID=UPI001B285395|nr:hypothetical protein [Chitinophaga sp.]MBO9730218.1 hypothetical protein [Chitinophaga sp.]
MLLFNFLLLTHFAAFLIYLCRLALLFPVKNPPKDKWGLPLGITILLTGLALVWLKYPVVNYYKVGPKLGLFLVVTVVNAMHDKKPLSKSAYYVLLACTVLAGMIAVTRV